MHQSCQREATGRTLDEIRGNGAGPGNCSGHRHDRAATSRVIPCKEHSGDPKSKEMNSTAQLWSPRDELPSLSAA